MNTNQQICLLCGSSSKTYTQKEIAYLIEDITFLHGFLPCSYSDTTCELCFGANKRNRNWTDLAQNMNVSNPCVERERHPCIDDISLGVGEVEDNVITFRYRTLWSVPNQLLHIIFGTPELECWVIHHGNCPPEWKPIV